jgi:hypothetical protein
MTTSTKQRKVVIRQCRSVEKLAEAVERVNGVDVEFSSRLKCIKTKMQEAYSSMHDDEIEITEEIAILRAPVEEDQE